MEPERQKHHFIGVFSLFRGAFGQDFYRATA